MADDLFAPVEGVTLETYARLAVQLAGKDDRAQLEALAAQHGVPPGRFDAISAVWSERVMGNREVGLRYTELFQAATKEAGIEAPDLSLEQYAAILSEMQAGKPMHEVCEGKGLTVQQFSMASQAWAEKLMANPMLGVQLAQLMQDGHAHEPPTDPPINLM